MYILIDIGGTKTRIALSQNKTTFSEPYVYKTGNDFGSWLAMLHQFSANLQEVEGVIVGIPGTFSHNGTIIQTPNLPLWQGIPIQEHIEKIIKAPLYLFNDTALVGLGEALYGAGKGEPIVAYLTISTGVNGVRIVDGAIDKNIHGFEIGHTIVNIEEKKDIESFIGGGSLEKKLGKPSREVHDAMMWEKISSYAGIFAANTTMYWSPSAIVFGGPVMNDLDISIIEKEAKKILSMYTTFPQFKRAELKDFGGLYGALAVSISLQEKKRV